MTEFDNLLETLKRTAAALRDADVPFLLGGGLAVAPKTSRCRPWP
jgi:hypothetical protein